MNNKKLSHLLILVALEVEEVAITAQFPIHTRIEINKNLGFFGQKIQMGELVVTVLNAGIGIVNAGLAVALTNEKLAIDGIILLGVAGALQTEIDIGEIVFAKAIYQHDSFLSQKSGIEPMAPGFPYLSIPAENRASPRFETDPDVYSWLLSKNLKFKAGDILSGSEFVGSFEAKRNLAQRYENAIAVEMEAAGVALVAKKLGLPFAVVKTIADRVSPDGSISSDYKKFLNHAAAAAAKIVLLIAQDQ